MSMVSCAPHEEGDRRVADDPGTRDGREPAEPLAGQVRAFGLAESVEGHAVPPPSWVPHFRHRSFSSGDNTALTECMPRNGPASERVVEPARRDGERVGGAIADRVSWAVAVNDCREPGPGGGMADALA